jgi:hypothetical protein
MPVLLLGGLGVCAGYAFAVWVKGQEPPKGKDPSIKHASLGALFGNVWTQKKCRKFCI